MIHDCIRACVYGDYIARQEVKKDAWLSIGDMCYADAVLSWNMIFGARSQDSHWKKFTKDFPLPHTSNLRPFSKELIIVVVK